ncbi:MAG: DNA polymerase III subunit gamma/tau C-terminal domain-containing protein, partial [Pseudomonadales bacterium]
NSFGDREIVLEFAGKFSPEDVQLYYQMGSKGREDLRFATELRSAFEMLLIRMLVFSPDYVAAKEKAAGESDTAAASPSPAKIQKKKIESNKPLATEPALADSVAARDGPPAEQSNANEEKLAALTHQRWLQIYPQLELNGIAANVLANCVLIGATERELQFQLDQDQSAVYSEELVPKLSQGLSKYFKREISVQISIASVSEETASAQHQRIKQENHEAMVNDFEQDENVQELLKHFSGTVARDTIAPLEESKDK